MCSLPFSHVKRAIEEERQMTCTQSDRSDTGEKKKWLGQRNSISSSYKSPHCFWVEKEREGRSILKCLFYVDLAILQRCNISKIKIYPQKNIWKFQLPTFILVSPTQLSTWQFTSGSWFNGVYITSLRILADMKIMEQLGSGEFHIQSLANGK